MQCLTNTSGTYTVMTTQPDLITDCTAILVTPTELTNEIISISPSQGAQIGAAIIFVWAVAWAFRVAISSLNSHFESENSNE